MNRIQCSLEISESAIQESVVRKETTHFCWNRKAVSRPGQMLHCLCHLLLVNLKVIRFRQGTVSCVRLRDLLKMTERLKLKMFCTE